MHIEEHVPLATLTTFGIGGPARYFIWATSLDELREGLRFADERQLPFFVLGGGSNVLIDDRGFGGVVIHIAIEGIQYEVAGSHTTVIVGAGESWDGLVSEVVDKELWGIENLSGVPGTVGGAVVGNIGAYGQVQSQTLQWVEVLNTKNNVIECIENTQCQFGYRESIFTHDAGTYIVVRAAYALSHEAKPELSYADLQKTFADQANPSLLSIREAVLHIREGKFPDLLQEGSAGSFFKNPIVSKEEAAVLRERYPDMPQFSMPETAGVKIPLGWLIDHVLHLKGYSEDGARLFEKQALVIAAKRGTSANAVRALANTVREKIFSACGIAIEHEVKIIS